MDTKTTQKKERKPRRTQKELTEVLFSALATMLSDQKFREIGINDLTTFAKIDKNFIYKHYGDIDGLLREYVKRNDYWGKAVLAPETYHLYGFKDILTNLLHGLYHSFSENIDFQNIIRWEIASSNEYVKENARQREIEGIPLKAYADKYHEKHPDKDIPCLFALFSAGIYYLILHKNISTFGGIDFSDKKQADRILGVINSVTDYIFEDYIKTKTIVDKLYEKNFSIQEIAEITSLSENEIERIHTGSKDVIP